MGAVGDATQFLQSPSTWLGRRLGSGYELTSNWPVLEKAVPLAGLMVAGCATPAAVTDSRRVPLCGSLGVSSQEPPFWFTRRTEKSPFRSSSVGTLPRRI